MYALALTGCIVAMVWIKLEVLLAKSQFPKPFDEVRYLKGVGTFKSVIQFAKIGLVVGFLKRFPKTQVANREAARAANLLSFDNSESYQTFKTQHQRFLTYYRHQMPRYFLYRVSKCLEIKKV